MLIIILSSRRPIDLDSIDADIPARVGASIAPTTTTAAARKRALGPQRTSKDAERAAKKARLETSRRDGSSTVSKTSGSAADQGGAGGEGSQPVDPIAPSPPWHSDPVFDLVPPASSPIQTTTPPPTATATTPVAPTTSPITTTTPPVITASP